MEGQVLNFKELVLPLPYIPSITTRCRTCNTNRGTSIQPNHCRRWYHSTVVRAGYFIPLWIHVDELINAMLWWMLWWVSEVVGLQKEILPYGTTIFHYNYNYKNNIKVMFLINDMSHFSTSYPDKKIIKNQIKKTKLLYVVVTESSFKTASDTYEF